jgi:DNA-binding IclR family transcriptional regulator
MTKAKTPTKPVSKISAVADLLRREGGATLAELVAATGWQPHTTRAALTGLRKKGHKIERGTRDGETTWSVAAS